MYLPLNRRDFLRAAVLAIGAALFSLWMQDGFSAKAWETPSTYTIDALEVLARMEAAREAGWAGLVDETMPRLGAPWVADWSAYAMPDRWYFLLAGGLADLVGLPAAAGIALVLAHVLAVLALYACSRTLGHRPEFAAAAAVLFGFSYFNFGRGLSHFSFTLSFIVPLAVLVALLAGGSRVLWRRRACWWSCLAIAVAAGLANAYYGAVFVQLFVLAWLYRVWVRREPGAWRRAWILGAFAVAFVLGNLGPIAALGDGREGVLARNYSGTELYGLRFVELFVPPPSHRLPAAAAIGAGYRQATMFKGELFLPYLGLAGMAGVAVLTWSAVRRLAAQRFGLRPALLPWIGWLLLGGSVGGLNAVFALAVTPVFRGTNRLSIFILALALLGLAGWASRRARRVPRAATIGCALAFTLAGLWEQTPPLRHASREGEARARIAADRHLAERLETGLPAGAMVFQLPVVPFLEQPPVGQMNDYEEFRPFLFTRTVRFSYGLLAGDPRLRWQQNVALRPAPALRAALERAGFAAVCINRTAYPDNGDTLAAGFEAAGLTRFFAEGDHLVFRLQPSPAPELPALEAAELYEPWAPPDAAPAGMAFVGGGWFGLEKDGARLWRWAGREAVMLLHNPAASERDIDLACAVSALQATRLVVRLADRPVWDDEIRAAPRAIELRLRLQPGLNRLHWRISGAPHRPSSQDPRKLGFCVTDLRIAGPAAP